MTRHRKEAIVLVLAAVILGVSVFSLIRKPTPRSAKQETKTAAQVEQKGQAQEAAAGAVGGGEETAALAGAAGTRNPFAAPSGAAGAVGASVPGPGPAVSAGQEPGPGTTGPPRPAPAVSGPTPPPAPGEGGAGPATITLTGIVTGQPSVAVIYHGDQRRYARVGDRIGDYRVQSIGRQEVVLVGPTGKLILRMGGRQ